VTGVTTVGGFAVHQAAFFSTHHASAGDALAARERPFTPPAYGLLVGRARRFTSLVTQLHVEVCGALRLDAGDPPMTVFATREGEIQTAEKLIADFRDAQVVSSARFALSVHNTAAGVYSVATGSHAAATTVTGDNAVAAGWLEAVLTALDAGRRVVLSIADEPVPAAFHGPSGAVGVAAAFLIGPAGSGGRTAELAIAPAPATKAGDDGGSGDLVGVLARAVDACARGDAASTALGAIGPGAVLALRLSEEARA
jgi:hypothetical protein